MNYSFEPSLDIRSNTILGSGTSVVYLNQDGSKSIIDNIFKSSGYDNRAGKSRFNPMTAVIRTKGFKQLPREKRIPNDIVKQYEACKTSKFVHYHGGCQRLLQKEKLNSSCRSEFISRFRPA